MKKNNWNIKPLDLQAKELAQKHAISVFLVQILINRGIKEEDFNDFLDADLSKLHDPFLLPDLDKAVRRIFQAIEKKEKVLVFGDYDVDGIISLAIFNEFARDFPNIFSFHIPHRVNEGYGLNKEAVTRAKEKGESLIIAFDCGTNAEEEIKLTNLFNIDLVVIDHHHCQSSNCLPFALVNPKREDSAYPFSELTAGALSFKLLQVLKDDDCFQALDLLALSLVCDVALLKGENRLLLKEGLKIIRQSKRLSIKALCETGSLRQEQIDVFHIGYIIGPRINASGRVADPYHSFELFLTDDWEKARLLSCRLTEYNRLRKSIEGKILKKAETIIQGNTNNDHAIVVFGENWHPGVLGIVASRLADKYCRPSFVISLNGDIGKGSARSACNVNLIDILDECASSLLVYGGHSKAAGVQIAKQELTNFKNKVNSIVESELTLKAFVPVSEIDAELTFSDITIDFLNSLEKLKPYGEGNACPVFIARNIFKKTFPKKIRTRFSIWLSDKSMTLEGLIADKDILGIINDTVSFDLIFSVEKNFYYNIPRLIIKGCRLS